jgi:hypothetical protein
MTLYGTFPLLVPGSTESQSVYGLKKTSGTILFKAGEEGAALTLAEQSGSVFPDPQVRTTDMGLLEMSFDAYMDTGATSGVFATDTVNLSKNFEQTVGETTQRWTVSEVWITDSYTERKVFPAAYNSTFINTASPRVLGTKLLKRVILGNRPSGGAGGVPLTWQAQVSSVTRRNFGIFDEVDVVTSFVATVL